MELDKDDVLFSLKSALLKRHNLLPPYHKAPVEDALKAARILVLRKVCSKCAMAIMAACWPRGLRTCSDQRPPPYECT